MNPDIPALTTLQAIPNWVGWRYELRKGKQTKIPKNAITGGNADSTNPATWTDYATAAAAAAQHGWNGVGFVFAGGGVAGIDLDDCIDNGRLADWAAEIVAELDSYAEVSPSGTGLKIFIRGRLPRCGKKHDIEMYDQGRYFTVTGNHWPGTPDTLNERSEAAAALAARLWPPEAVKSPATAAAPRVADTDAAIIEKASAARNGDKFRQLWRGDCAGYHSRSEAHLALCNLLAFWTGNDEAAIDRLFRQSALFSDYTEKWDERHFSDDRTYGQATIQKAMAGQTQTYTPRNRNGHGDGLAEMSPPPAADTADNIPLAETPAELAADDIRDHIPHYTVEYGQMVHNSWKTVGGELILVKKYVAPFTAVITEKLIIYNEAGQEVVYTISGQRGRRKFTAKVTADEWADSKQLVRALLRYLPGLPPDTDPDLRKHWGPAIAHLTKEVNMKTINAIPSTGWTPDGQAYAMPAGSVGEGYVCHLSEPLDYELRQFGVKAQERPDNRRALAALLWLTKIYRPSAIYTLLAHAFLPPLLRWCGDEARYLLHIHADTGSLKTELAKIIMGLYGPTGETAITYKWSGTPYGVESRAYALKDALMLLDDLKPGTISEQDKQKWVSFVQAAVDALGRKRATMGGKAAGSLPPRALILSTGEAVPEAGEASYTARMLLVELNSRPAEAARNRTLDRLRDEYSPLLSGLMREYLAWLLAGDGRDAKAEYRRLQTEGGASTFHARLANNYASNRLGMVMLARFCREHGYLTPRATDQLLKRHKTGLLSVIQRTDMKAHGERYSQRFIGALRDALSTGFCHLTRENGKERRVGWEDEHYLYLLSGSKEIIDQWLRHSGQTPIHITKAALRKQLYDDGLAYSTEARVKVGQYDCQVRDPADEKYQMVTTIYRSVYETL